MLKLGMDIVLPILSLNQVQIALNTCFFLATIIMKALFSLQVQYIITLFQTGHLHQKIAQAASVSPEVIFNI
jgi:hypothetical protein